MDPDNQLGPLGPTSGAEVGRFDERLTEAIGSRSVRDFARGIGLSESVVRQYLRGKSEPTRPALLSMARAAGVTVEWLATGEGPKEKGEAASPAEAWESAGYVPVPVYSARAAAGAGAENAQEEVAELQWFSPRLAAALGVRSGAALDGLFVEGDSMQPELGPGDVIVIDRRKPVFTGEAMYVVRIDQVLVVKRVQPMGRGLVRLVSANPAFTAMDINMEDFGQHDVGAPFEFIGRVVWLGKRV